jgi:hypothetical protein
MTLIVGQHTDTMSMRAVFREDESGQLDLVQTQDHFFDLSGFMYVNYLGVQSFEVRGPLRGVTGSPT